MSDIQIRRSHSMSAKAARKAAEKIASQLDEEFDLAYEWDDNVLLFKRSGVSGELVVEKKEDKPSAPAGGPGGMGGMY